MKIILSEKDINNCARDKEIAALEVTDFRGFPGFDCRADLIVFQSEKIPYTKKVLKDRHNVGFSG